MAGWLHGVCVSACWWLQKSKREKPHCAPPRGGTNQAVHAGSFLELQLRGTSVASPFRFFVTTYAISTEHAFPWAAVIVCLCLSVLVPGCCLPYVFFSFEFSAAAGG